jgi:hypothetical protein
MPVSGDQDALAEGGTLEAVGGMFTRSRLGSFEKFGDG